MSAETNPLSKYFRKPTIYVQIPTGGRFNPEIDKTILDEIPVLPMNAIDEISMQNPDELLNGEALINLIKSCVPSIPNPRELCNIDAELLYLAIKYATYGKNIQHLHTCTECKEQAEYNIDINKILDRFPDIQAVDPVEYEDLKIHIHPPKVESLTRLALIDVEQHRILNSMKETAEGGDEMEMAKQFAISFRKVSTQTISLLISSISQIETPDAIVTNEKEIGEFINNIPTGIIKEIDEKIAKLSKKPEGLTTFEFICEKCQHPDAVTFELNPVNFS
jgi:hypothetical protein